MTATRIQPGPVACEAVEGLVVDLEVAYAASFRRFQATSLILSYPVPPFTTLRGLLANALGLTWVDPLWGELERTLLFNVRPLAPLHLQEEMVKLLKASSSAEEGRQRPTRRFPSSPVYRQFYLRPSYRVYVAVPAAEPDAASWVETIRQALEDPARPLYLGTSDDLVDGSVRWRGEATRADGEPQWGLVPARSMEAEGLWLRLPWARGGQPYPTLLADVVLPAALPVRARGVPGYRFGEEAVALYGGVARDG